MYEVNGEKFESLKDALELYWKLSETEEYVVMTHNGDMFLEYVAAAYTK